MPTKPAGVVSGEGGGAVGSRCARVGCGNGTQFQGNAPGNCASLEITRRDRAGTMVSETSATSLGTCFLYTNTHGRTRRHRPGFCTRAAVCKRPATPP